MFFSGDILVLKEEDFFSYFLIAFFFFGGGGLFGCGIFIFIFFLLFINFYIHE